MRYWVAFNEFVENFCGLVPEYGVRTAFSIAKGAAAFALKYS